MVKQRNLDNFCKYVTDLMSYIRKITPESEYSYHSQIFSRFRKANKEQYMNDVFKYLDQYSDQISKFDEFIFTPEHTKGKLQMYFFVGYDFCKLWKHPLTNEQKRIIWRYLQLMYIHASVALGKNKDKVTMLAENIKAEDEINKDAIANPNQLDEKGGGGLMDFAKIFGNNDLLMELAKDVSSELNLQDTLKDLMANGNIKPGANPMETISNLCQNKEIQNIVQNLQKKVTQKMADRNLDKNDLLASANALQTNLMSSLNGIPGGKQLSKMFNGMNIDKLMQQMAQSGVGGGGDNATSGVSSTPANPPQLGDLLNTLTNNLNSNPETAQLLQQLSNNTNTIGPTTVGSTTTNSSDTDSVFPKEELD